MAIQLGSEVVTNFINTVPKVIIDGLKVAGNLLPAIGFALLINMLMSKKVAVFFFIGFLLVAYIGLNITDIALFGACIAVVFDMLKSSDKENINESVQKNNLLEGEIDFE